MPTPPLLDDKTDEGDVFTPIERSSALGAVRGRLNQSGWVMWSQCRIFTGSIKTRRGNQAEANGQPMNHYVKKTADGESR